MGLRWLVLPQVRGEGLAVDGDVDAVRGFVDGDGDAFGGRSGVEHGSEHEQRRQHKFIHAHTALPPTMICWVLSSKVTFWPVWMAATFMHSAMECA